MRTQISIPAPSDWNAHLHRDFIDDFSVKLSQCQHQILALALRNMDSERAHQIEQLQLERLFRVSYPRQNLNAIEVHVTSAPMESLEKIIREDQQEMLKEVSKSRFSQLVDWLAKKCLGPEEFKKALEESEKEFVETRVKKGTHQWENELHSAFLTIMGQQLRASFDVFTAQLHYEGLVAHIPLSQILDDQAKMDEELVSPSSGSKHKM